LLNYLTAPNVLIWSAASASCAIPGVYQPVPLLAKTRDGDFVPWNPSGTSWVDGSVEKSVSFSSLSTVLSLSLNPPYSQFKPHSDLPIARLSELFNVNHFIVSQVNPHVIPFIQKTKNGFSVSISFTNYPLNPFYSIKVSRPGTRFSFLIQSEATHRIQQVQI